MLEDVLLTSTVSADIGDDDVPFVRLGNDHDDRLIQMVDQPFERTS